MTRSYSIPGYGHITETSPDRGYSIPGYGQIHENTFNAFLDSFTESITVDSTVSALAAFLSPFSDSFTAGDIAIMGLQFTDTINNMITLAGLTNGGIMYLDDIPEGVSLVSGLTGGLVYYESVSDDININGVSVVEISCSAMYGGAMYGRCQYANDGTQTRTIVATGTPGVGYISITVQMFQTILNQILLEDFLNRDINFAFVISDDLNLSESLRLITDFEKQMKIKRLGSRKITIRLLGSTK